MTKQERRKFLKAALAAMATATGAAGCRAVCYTYFPAPAPEPSERREELKQQLEKLAEEEPPKVREPGAMCYSIVPLPIESK